MRRLIHGELRIDLLFHFSGTNIKKAMLMNLHPHACSPVCQAVHSSTKYQRKWYLTDPQVHVRKMALTFAHVFTLYEAFYPDFPHHLSLSMVSLLWDRYDYVSRFSGEQTGLRQVIRLCKTS